MKCLIQKMVILFFIICPCLQAAPYYSKGENKSLVSSIYGQDEGVIKKEVKVDYSAVTPGEKSKLYLSVNDELVEVRLYPLSQKRLGLPKKQYAWYGKGEGLKDFYLMKIKEGYEGSFQSKGYIHLLHSLNGQLSFLETRPKEYFRESPEDGVPPEDSLRGKPIDHGDSDCIDPSSQIDVMILYTPDTRDAAGGVVAIENEIAFAVGRANLALTNSAASHRLNLVYTGLANYNEPAGGVDSNALLGLLHGTSDGTLDTVHGLRDSVKADLVSLFYEVDDGNWCGWGNTREVADADTTDEGAFTVVQRSCAGGYLSYAHEVGHNMGALHDVGNVSGPVLSYNRAHLQPFPSSSSEDPWRTVMGYNGDCEDDAGEYCVRLAYFSNPDVSYAGDDTGVVDAEDNVRVFEANDQEVSKYRCARSDGGPNVWMKDAWPDTGLEPDPATAGMPMYKSPYIWVRRSLDTGLEHEHEHENPLVSITNYVYVKLHNTGNMSESSDIELYYASASTNLNNPSNWNLIGTQPLNMSPGTEVVNFSWSGLPGTGHYCLLARWNIDGTPLSFSNLNTAVRDDNDLVWRNVNIVGMGDGDAYYSFRMAGVERLQETYLLITTTPMSPQPTPWKDLFKQTLTIDPKVLNLGNLRFENLQQIDKTEFVVPLNERVSIVGPFNLKPGQITDVKMASLMNQIKVDELSKDLANPRYYDIGVVQIHPKGVELAREDLAKLFNTPGLVIGGVNYTITLPAGQE